MSIRGTVTRVAFALLCVHPLSALAQPASTSEPQGFVAEPNVIERAVLFADRHISNGDVTNGFYVDSWNMIPGAGWISAGPGYRHSYQRSCLRQRVCRYLLERIQDHASPIRITEARQQQTRVGIAVRVARPRKWTSTARVPTRSNLSSASTTCARADLVGYATLQAPRAGGYRSAHGLAETQPAVESATGVASEVSMTADTRDFPGHPTRGGLVRAALADYDDRDAGVFSFRRYDAEAAHFIPLAGSRVVMGLHGWLVATGTDEGRLIPFYLQPSLGGHNSLRSYLRLPVSRPPSAALQCRGAHRHDGARRWCGLPRRRQCRRACRRSEFRQAIVRRRTPPAYAPTDVCPF